MSKVLIVSTAEYIAKLSAMLSEAGFDGVEQAHSGIEARRLIVEREYALLIINTPLVDEFGYDLSIYATENTAMSVLVLAHGDVCDAIENKVEDYGVVVVSKPVTSEGLFKTLKALYANHNRINSIMKSNRRLQDKLEELKLVDRAKCILIAHKGMSEEDAHRYIESKAMDMRVSKKEIAQKIISLKQYD